jgi:hypothetical protein
VSELKKEYEDAEYFEGDIQKIINGFIKIKK